MQYVASFEIFSPVLCLPAMPGSNLTLFQEGACDPATLATVSFDFVCISISLSALLKFSCLKNFHSTFLRFQIQLVINRTFSHNYLIYILYYSTCTPHTLVVYIYSLPSTRCSPHLIETKANYSGKENTHLTHYILWIVVSSLPHDT